MRRRIRYRSRAAALCMAAVASFSPFAANADDAPAAAPVVEEAAPFEASIFGPPALPVAPNSLPIPVAMIQPVEFNPVIAPVGDRIVLADASPELAPTPLPMPRGPIPVASSSMPRMAPRGYPTQQPSYDVQFQFVQDTFQPLDTGPLGTQTTPDMGGLPSFGGGQDLIDFTQSFNGPSLTDKPAEVLSGQTAAISASVDTGQLVSDATSVSTQRRSPVNFDPHIRGYRWGQVYTSASAQWAPIRPDLDSVLSKIDTNLIDNVVIIPGPYGLRYGPGLSYMDIVLVDSPRYVNGPESHARIGLRYRGNGDQVNGNVALYGGGSDYGYLFNYTVRTGIDYDAGDGTQIPSSYNSQNFYGQVGFDLSADSKIDIRYIHMDQNDTEYAGQFFDLDYLGTDAVTINYVNDDFGAASRLIMDAWYNNSRYLGDTDGPGKRSPIFPVMDRLERGLTIEQPDFTPAVADDDFMVGDGPFDFGVYDPATRDTVGFSGFTRGDQTVAGGRTALTFGDEGYTQMDVGVDFRYRQQTIIERFNFSFIDVESGGVFPITEPFSPTGLGPFTTNLPRSNSANPGVFLEMEMPFTEYWTTSAGARVDYAYTTAFNGYPFGRRGQVDPMAPNDDPANIINNPSSLPVPDGADLERDDILYHFFLTNDIVLTEEWSSRVGFGHAQRAPTLLDRYADGVFLGIFQSGFSRVIGNPDVEEEKAWQIDVGLDYEGYNFRGRMSLYHAWILDYITYSVNTVPNLAGARLYQTINTKYATLSGFEAYGEYDLSESLQLFGMMGFVEGRDHAIQQPLPGISPFEGTVGVRLLDRSGGDTWGMEFGTRMVHEQERLGALRATGIPGSVVVIEEKTPGFTTLYVRGYYNVTENLNFVGGVENLGDRLYQEHLDLRLPPSNQTVNPDIDFEASRVYAPGITPYIGVEATY